MSALAIVLIALAALVLLFFAVGAAVRARRDRAGEADYARHLSEADHALEQARAGDKGWDRVPMEDAARAGVEQARPGWSFDRLDLVLVDDRPGVEEDRAHFEASGGSEKVRIVLGRGADGAWVAQQVG